MELNEKQLQILEVAEKLFAENSFDGTSVRQIAKEADVNVAMISYYFGSKEKLLETLLNYRNGDFRLEIIAIIENDSLSALEKLDEIVAYVIRRIHKNRRTHKIVNIEYSNGCRNLNFKSHIEQKRISYKVIEDFIKEGQDNGVFAKNIQIPLITTTIMGTYFHFYYNKKFFQLLHDVPLDNYATLDDFVHTKLTQHIQQTIKALLTNEN
ncbi:TetR family transcriptional regulator [Zhouia sp. PK063]|uniref:TetR family transcriptional regulator n=1 Tax=Zhouia sp. PK063 TaxID=3373602 RepID=UPI00378FAD48